jgi:hypothetical protein
MTSIVYEFRHHTATVVFDLEDAFARERAVRGLHPRPIGPVRFFLIGQVVGGVRQDFPDPLELSVVRTPSGYDLFYDTVRLANRSSRQWRLPDGVYVMRVATPDTHFYQAAERQDVAFGNARAPFVFSAALQPGYGYPFPREIGSIGAAEFSPSLLRGSVFDSGGTGVADVLVQAEVPALALTSSTYRTDATGEWVVIAPDTFFGNPPQANVMATVHFTFPGNVVVSVPNVDVARGRERSLRPTALRGQVLNAQGLPVANATIGVSGQATSVITNRDGNWFFNFPLDQAAVVVSVTARLASGASLVEPAIGVQPRATVRVPTFRF